MSDQQHKPMPPDPDAARRRQERISIIRRFYTLIPIIVVVYLSYQAFDYLVVSLIRPPKAPKQITKIPKRLTREVWETRREEWAGVEFSPTPRTPLAHYHRIQGWFQPDPHNDCIRSGCHSPLPHNRHKEVRAFLNMHATSIHCGVCHFKTDVQPRPLVWYDLKTGRATDPPALLRAYAWALSAKGQEAVAHPTRKIQKFIVKLMRQAARQADDLTELHELANKLHAFRYTSEPFKRTLLSLPATLPLYFHGEYGEKLAIRDPQTGQPILKHRGSEQAVREFLQRGAEVGPQEREAILQRVHTMRAPETLNCLACHTRQRSLVDLKTVGYPPQRIKSLYDRWIFHAIQDIREGRPLYLPGFIGPRTQPESTTRPASEPVTP